MDEYKQAFIEFMVECEVLRFGNFTTKSGRKTPYFINAGNYRTGSQMRRLAEFYAQAIVHNGVEYDFLFGPAYKGIPLAVSVAMSLAKAGRDVPFCFNRKEAKAHGEGGSLVGHVPQHGQRVLFVEDVTTAGTSIRETTPVLQSSAEVKLAGLVVSVDRQERGTSDATALTEIGQSYNMATFAIVTVTDIMQHLSGNTVNGERVLTQEHHAEMQAYLSRYGGARE